LFAENYFTKFVENIVMIYIAIVDDKKSIRTTLMEKLNRFPGIEVLFTAENGEDFLKIMRDARNNISPDLVLMDIDMPIMNGILAVAEAKVRYPLVKFLMLTIFDEDDKIFNAIKSGADGYLLKDEPVEKIKEAIEHILNEQGAPMSPSIARKVLHLLTNPPQNTVEEGPKDNDYKLTEREKQILELLVEGLEYKEIAQELYISPNTVRNNITKIYSKMHVTSRMQAVKVFRKR
jgi:DNA-binding NarL/FixJ family response regulator